MDTLVYVFTQTSDRQFAVKAENLGMAKKIAHIVDPAARFKDSVLKSKVRGNMPIYAICIIV